MPYFNSIITQFGCYRHPSFYTESPIVGKMKLMGLVLYQIAFKILLNSQQIYFDY